MIVMAKLSGRDFLGIHDFEAKELLKILGDAARLKDDKTRKAGQILDRKILGMIFANPSTRTRISFESSIVQLGGHAFNYRLDELQLSHQESYRDTGKVMSRYLDGLVIRWYGGPYMSGRKIIEEFAEGADIPVISGNDDLEHPCQAVADMMTIREKRGDLRKLKLAILWGFSNRVKPLGAVHSLLQFAAKVGLNTAIAYPRGYDIDPNISDWVKENATNSGSQVVYTNDVHEALEGADVVYVKNWRNIRMTEEEERRDRLNHERELREWLLTKQLMEFTNSAMFMHPLPADRNMEVVDEVIDGPQSVVLHQAENRLHGQKAILANLLR